MSDCKKEQFSTTQSDRETLATADEDLNLKPKRPLQSSPLGYDVSNELGNYQLAPKLDEKSDCVSEFAENDKENNVAEVLKTPETKANTSVPCIFDTDLTPIDRTVSPTTGNSLQERIDDSSTKFKMSLSFTEIEKSSLNDYLKSTTEGGKDLINDSSITQLERIQNQLFEEERPLNVIIGDAQNSESLYDTKDLSSRSSSACSILLGTLTASENEMVDDVSPVIIDAESDGKITVDKRSVDGSSADTLMEPQPKKSKLDYDEMLYIGQEVSDIISPLTDDGDTDDKEDANLIANTPLVSNESFEQQQLTDENEQTQLFYQMLPYQTSDPEIIERQRTLLEMLINNNICTDENFRIFIAEPEVYKDEANRIVDQLYKIEVVPETDGKEDDDAEDVMDQEYFHNLTVIADTAPMSPDSQISDRMSSDSNDYELLLVQQEVSEIISRLFDDDTTNESLDQPLPDANDVLNQRYYTMLPYQTSDPEIIERQRTTLNMLINNNICTDRNFQIFIAEPDAYKDEANRILDQLHSLDVVYETDEDDDAEIPMDPEYLNNLTGVADATPMSLDSQISSDMTTSDTNDSATPKTNLPGVAEFSAAADTSSMTRESFDNIVGNNLKPNDDRQYQIDADEVEPSSL